MSFGTMAGATLATVAVAFLAGGLRTASAENTDSGYQVIQGTQVFTVIYYDRGYATFTNDCGTQTLTQGELQAGAIPYDVIPCPRPGASTSPSDSSGSSGSPILDDLDDAENELAEVQAERDKLVSEYEVEIDRCRRAVGDEQCRWAEDERREAISDWLSCIQLSEHFNEPPDVALARVRSNVECTRAEIEQTRLAISLAYTATLEKPEEPAIISKQKIDTYDPEPEDGRDKLKIAQAYMQRAQTESQYCTYADQMAAAHHYRLAARAFEEAGDVIRSVAADGAADVIVAPGGTAELCDRQAQQKAPARTAAAPAARQAPEPVPPSCGPAIEKMRSLAAAGGDVSTLRVQLAAFGCKDPGNTAPMDPIACATARAQWQADGVSDAEARQRLAKAGCRP